MKYAPFCFWFWDEPLEADKYPAKARTMAHEMLRQGLNPGYAHPRVSMADLVGPKAMAPSPSLPKEQWLSETWFEAFDAALQEAEAADGYLGYVDEYMWPNGRAAGRVIQQHPELASASLQWEVTDVSGGTLVEFADPSSPLPHSSINCPRPAQFAASAGSVDLAASCDQHSPHVLSAKRLRPEGRAVHRAGQHPHHGRQPVQAVP